MRICFVNKTSLFKAPRCATAKGLECCLRAKCQERQLAASHGDQRSRLSTGTAEMASAGVKRKTTP